MLQASHLHVFWQEKARTQTICSQEKITSSVLYNHWKSLRVDAKFRKARSDHGVDRATRLKAVEGLLVQMQGHDAEVKELQCVAALACRMAGVSCDRDV